MNRIEQIQQVKDYIEMLQTATQRCDWVQVADIGFALGHLADQLAKPAPADSYIVQQPA